MLICHCKCVNDRQIRAAIQEGARTVAQIGRACGAATACAGCARAVVEQLELEQDFQKLPIAAE